MAFLSVYYVINSKLMTLLYIQRFHQELYLFWLLEHYQRILLIFIKITVQDLLVSRIIMTEKSNTVKSHTTTLSRYYKGPDLYVTKMARMSYKTNPDRLRVLSRPKTLPASTKFHPHRAPHNHTILLRELCGQQHLFKGYTNWEMLIFRGFNPNCYCFDWASFNCSILWFWPAYCHWYTWVEF